MCLQIPFYLRQLYDNIKAGFCIYCFFAIFCYNYADTRE